MRRLLREAHRGDKSARELRDDLKLNVTVRRVQQVLSECSTLTYRKMLKAPMLTAKNRIERLRWARRYISRGDNYWLKVVFSDEKKFNLQVPDGFSCYWHDLRREVRCFPTRQMGGGSLMMWGAISLYGVSQLVIMRSRQDSQKY